MLRTTRLATALALALGASATALAGDLVESLQKGTPEIKSAGPLAFGPEGVLFIGDSAGAAVFAVATDDTHGKPDAIKVEDLAARVADALGSKPADVTINDMAVNPASGKVYLSVTRSSGGQADPAILRVAADGKIEAVGLDGVKFARVDLPSPPSPNAQERGQSLRSESITDLGYAGGHLYVAGLSNEEFSSRLLAIPVPFQDLSEGASIEIYHASHGRFETRSPIRTFLTTEIAGEPHLLAAYTCTPLVKVPLSELRPGAHVKGTTIAELGNRNRPLDMIAYHKGDKDYYLLANNSRGVMKIEASQAVDAAGLTKPVRDKDGVAYEAVDNLKGVVQLDKLDDDRAVILVQDASGAMTLETVDLP